MQGNKAVVGVYSYVDDALKGVAIAQKENLDFRVYSPVPNHELDAAAMPGRSPVRFVTLTGAVTGLIFGFSLAVLCSLDWPLRVSAKDVVSIPGFVVIGYECTILFGAIATLIALFVFGRIPDVLRKAGYDPRFTQDKFGVVVGCEGREAESLKEKLLKTGADEVHVADAL